MKTYLTVVLLAISIAFGGCKQDMEETPGGAAIADDPGMPPAIPQVRLDASGSLFVAPGPDGKKAKFVLLMELRKFLRQQQDNNPGGSIALAIHPESPWSDALPLLNGLAAEGFGDVVLVVGDRASLRVTLPGWQARAAAIYGSGTWGRNSVTVELDRNSDLWINFERIGRIDDVDERILGPAVGTYRELPIILCIDADLDCSHAAKAIALCDNAGANSIFFRPRQLCGVLTYAVPWSTEAKAEEWRARENHAAGRETRKILEQIWALRAERITNAIASFSDKIAQTAIPPCSSGPCTTVEELRKELETMLQKQEPFPAGFAWGAHKAIVDIYHEIRGVEFARTTRRHVSRGMVFSKMITPTSPPRAIDGAVRTDLLAGDARRLNRLNAEMLGRERQTPRFDYGQYPETLGADLGVLHGVPGVRLPADPPEWIQWMYIDEWYLIGPFPNPKRTSLDRTFPPEKEVDLDIPYPSKDGKQVKWQYLQSNTKQIFLPHPHEQAIWYAWTEIHAAEDGEFFVIFGSSDTGKAWINGQLVFSGAKTPHTWLPDQRYKKISFRKGANPMLFRIENAYGACSFSAMVYIGIPAK